jgi:CrcB protein
MPPSDRNETGTEQASIDPDLLAPTPRVSGPRARRAHLEILLAIALGGAAGTPARYAIGRIIPTHPGDMPWATFLINVTGSFVLGILLTLIIERWPPTRYVRPFAAIGFLGAYTTFSTYMVETDLLIKNGDVGIAIAYVTGTLLIGLVAVYLGIVSVRIWPTIRGVRR